jgi:hypothetical protein
MTQSQFKKYLKRLIFISLSFLVLVGGFNWLVDPYSVYGTPKIKGFDALKPEETTHSRMTKAYLVQRLKPEAIVLGTSTAEWGIDPGHPGWSYQPVFNLGLPGGNIYEMLRYLQHANKTQPLKQVVLGLDFLAFSIHSQTTDASTEARLAVSYNGKQNSSFRSINDIIATLFSVDALGASLNTVKQVKDTLRYKSNGMNEYTEPNLAALNGYHGIFRMEEDSYSKNTSWRDDFQFQNAEQDKSPFAYYRQILQVAYSDNLDLRMFISPAHARLWELLADFGLWPNIEEWKHTLVTINEEEALQYDKTPFPLWDFSDDNELTTEAVPAVDDTQTIMHWFKDTRHYKKELGDLVLDRIFGYSAPGRQVPDDFGVLLNSGNIDSILQKIRSDRQKYQNTHPGDVAEIQALFK